MERLGFPVKIIEGAYENIKITTPEDIVLAEAFISVVRQLQEVDMRIGIGFDVHKLVLEGNCIGWSCNPFEKACWAIRMPMSSSML